MNGYKAEEVDSLVDKRLINNLQIEYIICLINPSKTSMKDIFKDTSKPIQNQFGDLINKCGGKHFLKFNRSLELVDCISYFKTNNEETSYSSQNISWTPNRIDTMGTVKTSYFGRFKDFAKFESLEYTRIWPNAIKSEMEQTKTYYEGEWMNPWCFDWTVDLEKPDTKNGTIYNYNDEAQIDQIEILREWKDDDYNLI